jgi:hypothetical protein
MNYAETKKELDRIRNEYGCKGEMIFRTSLQYIVEYGQAKFQDEEWVQSQLDLVNEKHNKADTENKILFIGREFEIALIECAREIAKVEAYGLLVYIQKEVWLSNEGGIDYKRAIELLKGCMYDIEQRENCEDKLTLDAFEDIGFDDEELTGLNFGYLFNAKEDEEYDD